jgi:hypothetical protein
MITLALLLLAAAPQAAPAKDDDVALRSELRRLETENNRLVGVVREREGLLEEVREQLGGLREDVKELKERPQPVAAPFLVAPPTGSDRLGVARTAVFAPRIDVDSFRRHDTVVLKLRRVEATAIRTVVELELTPDLSSIELPLDQNGALFIVEWSTSEGHIYDLVLRDGASGQPVASVPVKEKQSEGRFVLVGYRVD